MRKISYEGSLGIRYWTVVPTVALSRETPRPGCPERGLYLGQRLLDGSLYGRYVSKLPGGCRSTFVPPVVGTERAGTDLQTSWTPGGFVIVGRDIGRPVLITPERPEEFVGAVPVLSVESRPALDESRQ